jgi:hypothetical protein
MRRRKTEKMISMDVVNEFGAAAVVAVAAAALAFIVRELLLHYSRRLSVNLDRIKIATDALQKQAAELKDLLENTDVSDLIKDFLLEISGLIVDRNYARPVADWVEAGCPSNKAEGNFDDLKPILEQLRKDEPVLYERVVSIIRRMIIALMLQWRETREYYDRGSGRLATCNPAQSIDFAISAWTAAHAHKLSRAHEKGQKPENADCAG